MRDGVEHPTSKASQKAKLKELSNNISNRSIAEGTGILSDSLLGGWRSQTVSGKSAIYYIFEKEKREREREREREGERERNREGEREREVHVDMNKEVTKGGPTLALLLKTSQAEINNNVEKGAGTVILVYASLPEESKHWTRWVVYVF